MQQRSEETHNRILAAAQRLFAECGYEAASVADICAAAGVSKGAFYHHFSTKHAVFLELLRNWLDRLESGLNLIRQGEQNVPQTLVDMSAMMREVLQAADKRLPMFLEFWTQSSRNPIFWQETIAPYQHYQAFFTSLVKEGISEGSLKAVDPEITARVIISLAVGVLFQSLLDPQGADWEQVTRQGMRYFVEGLAKEGG